jgi:hypothetical protein
MTSAARPSYDLAGAKFRSGTVKASNTIRKGFPVKIDSIAADGHPVFVEAAAVTDNAIGLATDAAVAGAQCRVALWGPGLALGLVGTGGCTAGAPQKWVSNGLTDATVGGGTVKQVILGQALETGVAGDYVAINLSGFAWSVSA